MNERQADGIANGMYTALLYGPVNNEERAFLAAAARERISDPDALNATLRWIRSSRRTRRDAIALCKRWGIEFPDKHEDLAAAMRERARIARGEI